MSNKVFFISEADVKAASPISLNVEPAIINAAIADAQEIRIQDQISSKLYKKVQSLIVDGSITGTTNSYYKELLDDYIIPTQIKWTVYESIMYLTFKFTNKGMVQQNSENSTSISETNMYAVMNGTKKKAEFLNQRMSDYLIENYNQFPELSNATKISDLLKSNSPYSCGIVLDEDYDFSEELRKQTGNNTIG